MSKFSRHGGYRSVYLAWENPPVTKNVIDFREICSAVNIYSWLKLSCWVKGKVKRKSRNIIIMSYFTSWDDFRSLQLAFVEVMRLLRQQITIVTHLSRKKQTNKSIQVQASVLRRKLSRTKHLWTEKFMLVLCSRDRQPTSITRSKYLFSVEFIQHFVDTSGRNCCLCSAECKCTFTHNYLVCCSF